MSLAEQLRDDADRLSAAADKLRARADQAEIIESANWALNERVAVLGAEFDRERRPGRAARRRLWRRVSAWWWSGAA